MNRSTIIAKAKKILREKENSKNSKANKILVLDEEPGFDIEGELVIVLYNEDNILL